MSWTHTILAGCGIALTLNAFIPDLVLRPITRQPVPYEVTERVSVTLDGDQLYYSANFTLNTGCVRNRFEPLAITENSLSEIVDFRDLDGRRYDDARIPGVQTLDHVYTIPDHIMISGVDVGEPRYLELRTRHICNGHVVEMQFDRIDLKPLRNGSGHGITERANDGT